MNPYPSFPKARPQSAGRRLSPLVAGLLIGLMLAGAAQAQWKWRDADGRTQYSDRPPPFGTPDKDILSRPAAPRVVSQGQAAQSGASRPGASAASQAGAASAPAKAASTPAEVAAEAQRKAQEEQRRAQMRADNCRRARDHVASLENSPRISRLNAQGEREYLNEAQLQSERDHARSVMASDCQ